MGLYACSMVIDPLSLTCAVTVWWLLEQVMVPLELVAVSAPCVSSVHMSPFSVSKMSVSVVGTIS